MKKQDETNAERQQNFRERMAKEGRKEIRGVWVLNQHHDYIKRETQKLKQELEK